jgi:hypothetical protein
MAKKKDEVLVEEGEVMEGEAAKVVIDEVVEPVVVDVSAILEVYKEAKRKLLDG